MVKYILAYHWSFVLYDVNTTNMPLNMHIECKTRRQFLCLLYRYFFIISTFNKKFSQVPKYSYKKWFPWFLIFPNTSIILTLATPGDLLCCNSMEVQNATHKQEI